MERMLKLAGEILTHLMTVNLLYCRFSRHETVHLLGYLIDHQPNRRINELLEGSDIAAARNHLTLHGQTSLCCNLSIIKQFICTSHRSRTEHKDLPARFFKDSCRLGIWNISEISDISWSIESTDISKFKWYSFINNNKFQLATEHERERERYIFCISLSIVRFYI